MFDEETGEVLDATEEIKDQVERRLMKGCGRSIRGFGLQLGSIIPFGATVRE